MIAVSVSGIQHVAGNLQRLVYEMTVDVEKAMRSASLQLRGDLGRQMRGQSRYDPFLGRLGADPPYLARRTGELARSLTTGGVVYRIGDELRTAVGTNSPHALILEEGGTITGSPMLRIPLAPAQKASGEDRYAGQSVRGLKEFFVIKSHGGRLFLARGGGRTTSRGFSGRAGSSSIEFWYLLVHSVRIRPHKVFETVTRAIQPMVDRLIGNAVTVAVQRANNG